MKTIIIPIILLVLFTSCLNLDTQLYNSQKVDRYLLDKAKHEIEIPNTYNIPTNKINEVILYSNDNGNKAKIYGYYLGDIDKINTDTVILYCHGNKNNLDYYWTRAELLANIGGKNRFGVFVFDYRGYGMSEGESSESSLYADTRAALMWLKDKGLTNNRLIVYGYSLGTAPATDVASMVNNYPLNPSWLILESPFASSDVMVQDAAILDLPHGLFTNLKINNADKIRLVTCPFMWIHGLNDDFLNVHTEGEVVYKNYQGPYKEKHIISGAVHNNVPEVWGYSAYLDTLYKFIITTH